jgi:hypothetical protein
MGEYNRCYEHFVLLLACREGCIGLPSLAITLTLIWVLLVTRFASTLDDQFIENGSVCEEYDEDYHYVGQR